jgi:hypothetical protein
VSELDLSKTKPTRAAEMVAFIEYMRHPDRKIEDVWENTLLDRSDPDSPKLREVIALATLRNAAGAQDWIGRRKEYWSDIRAKVLDAAKDEIVQRELGEIAVMERMKITTEGHIFGDESRDIMPLKPETFEGAVGAYVKLDKRIGEKRTSTAVHIAKAVEGGATVPTGAPGAMAIPVIEDGLDETDIAEMSRAIAAKRAGLAPMKKEG